VALRPRLYVMLSVVDEKDEGGTNSDNAGLTTVMLVPSAHSRIRPAVATTIWPPRHLGTGLLAAAPPPRAGGGAAAAQPPRRA
jgi:hypothetical protein